MTKHGYHLVVAILLEKNKGLLAALRLGALGVPYASRGRDRVRHTGKRQPKIKNISRLAQKVSIKEVAEALGADPPISLYMIESHRVYQENLVLFLEPGANLQTSPEDDYLVIKSQDGENEVVFKNDEVVVVYIEETGQVLWPVNK